MTNLDIQAKTTKTATFDGTGVDVSGITGDWTLNLEILAMNDGDTVRFQFTDSVDNFSSDVLAGPTTAFTGKIVNYSAPFKRSWKKADFPDLRMGTASAKLRLSITAFSGSSKSITYQAYVQY